MVKLTNEDFSKVFKEYETVEELKLYLSEELSYTKHTDKCCLTFLLSRKLFSEYLKPLKKLVEYDRTVKIEISIDAKYNSLKNIYIEFERKKDKNKDKDLISYEDVDIKRIKIYFSGTYESYKVTNNTTDGPLDYYIFSKNPSTNKNLTCITSNLFRDVNDFIKLILKKKHDTRMFYKRLF